jgi:hypothetical protein
MKKMTKNKWILLLLMCTFCITRISAQEDSVPTKELVRLRYFNDKNVAQYLVLENSLKKGKEISPLAGKTFELFLDSIKRDNLIGKVTTDNNGRAKSFIPPSLKSAWEANSIHTFIVARAGEEEGITELEITKSKMQIDTASEDSTRNIIVQVSKYENGAWMPANEVEMKIGIKRLGGVLTAGDEETYTTDSTGTVSIEVSKKNIPGDTKGNLVLVAKTEDNDIYGNLSVEKVVPWGVAVNPDSGFFEKRTLWSTRFRAPYWLLMMAFSIIIVVWGTILYLVFQIVKIKKMGKYEV